MAKQKLDYKNELVQAARSQATELVTGFRTQAVLPLLPTIDLATRAWLAGHEAGRIQRRKEQRNG